MAVIDPSGVAPAAGLPGSKNSTVDPMYQARIYSRGGSESIDITTNLPESFTIGLSTGWDTPFNQPLSDLAAGAGGKIGAVAGAANQLGSAVSGQTTLTKWLSGQVWTSGSYIEISEIPITLKAKEDPTKEVLEPLISLLKMVAPSESEGVMGALKAPGPYLGTGDLGGDIITIEIGNFFKMSPCVIESVTGAFDTLFHEGSGRPLSVTVSVSLKSFFSVTKEDLDKFFTI